jgi:GTPase SAR1 family protein
VTSLEFPKHIARVYPWAASLDGLKAMQLSKCRRLESLPLDAIAANASMVELHLKGCKSLWSPPQEVNGQGGRATMEFLREVYATGRASDEMTLFVIGSGESGKTSLLSALKSGEDRAPRIHEDSRTVGIDIATYSPPGSGVNFRFFDLAGQAIYGKTHQYFLQRRAVYLLVWRAMRYLLNDMEGLRSVITHWMDALQLRIPGIYFMIVVTHIDTVDETTLDVLCSKVKEVVKDKLAIFNAECRSACSI